jgi:regulation of enolase protein 1 (concanavalin A-like superfamily)
MKRFFIITFISILATFCAVAQELRVPAIPYPLYLENSALEVKAIGNNHLRMVAPEKTDLYTTSDGKYVTNKSPRLLFKPDSLFILTARIHLDFKSKWDAGVLLIYNDSRHYAKFCFENDFKGQPRVVTVVCNEVADDCNSMAIGKNEVYFRITGSTKENTFNLYYSESGKEWFVVRGFRLNKTDNLRIGFSAQSPNGKQCSVDFTDISFQNRRLRDFWLGD